MTSWIDACAKSDIEAEESFRFDHSGRVLLIYRSPDDEYFATDGICTHEHIFLQDGLVMGYEVECPKHASTFDYRTGEALKAPACVDLRTYPVKIEGERVLIGL
ncbi:MocE family 2Fe-2S type ferredoxin [Rhizobium sp. 18055]|uniref:MocE family 2Fe-2S type ferredoxin n=1 Tax=Rhizobium sp. 18055 TaxID=2681403 RepID=UPI00135B83E7|nr:MocE family 2Fe-2S type ferredoxin [Rhizobium sp. 18055]